MIGVRIEAEVWQWLTVCTGRIWPVSKTDPVHYRIVVVKEDDTGCAIDEPVGAFLHLDDQSFTRFNGVGRHTGSIGVAIEVAAELVTGTTRPAAGIGGFITVVGDLYQRATGRMRLCDLRYQHIAATRCRSRLS